MISKKTINAIEVCVYLAGQRHAGYVTTTEIYTLHIVGSVRCV